MKYIATVLLAFFLLTPSVFAEEDNAVSPIRALEHRDALKERAEEHRENLKTRTEEHRAEVRENIEERRDEIKSNIEERRAEFASSTALRKAELQDAAKEHILQRAEHFIRLLNAMLLRFEGFADRIEARIAVLTEEGLDTSEAEAKLAEARTALEEAGDTVSSVETALGEALDSETPREALERVKGLLTEAKQALRAAHEALREALQALPARDTEEDN